MTERSERRNQLWTRADQINELISAIVELRGGLPAGDDRWRGLIARQEGLIEESDRVLGELYALYAGA
ncbi:MAG: hypothetical protein KGM42_01265 [Hyphomicrobiales bacterium]|nr:hypothetical protein [Hyphomicrobiales bacterium]